MYIAAGHTFGQVRLCKTRHLGGALFCATVAQPPKVVVAARNIGSMKGASSDAVVIRRNRQLAQKVHSEPCDFVATTRPDLCCDYCMGPRLLGVSFPKIPSGGFARRGRISASSGTMLAILQLLGTRLAGPLPRSVPDANRSVITNSPWTGWATSVVVKDGMGRWWFARSRPRCVDEPLPPDA